MANSSEIHNLLISLNFLILRSEELGLTPEELGLSPEELDRFRCLPDRPKPMDFRRQDMPRNGHICSGSDEPAAALG